MKPLAVHAFLFTDSQQHAISDGAGGLIDNKTAGAQAPCELLDSRKWVPLPAHCKAWSKKVEEGGQKPIKSPKKHEPCKSCPDLADRW